VEAVVILNKMARDVFHQLTQQKAIHNALEKFNRPSLATLGTSRQIMMDDQRGHYQVFNVGWHELERTFVVMLHLDLKDGLIWIQVDNNEPGIADALLEQGIPKEQIVLAFHAPLSVLTRGLLRVNEKAKS
jgi:XisI protein